MHNRVSSVFGMMLVTIGVVLAAHGRGFAASASSGRAHTLPQVRNLQVGAVREVFVRQDPFISPLADEAQTDNAAMPAADPVLRPLSHEQAPATDEPPAVRLRAVVVGRRSFALVDEAGVQRVITLGDKLGGSAVKAISMQGLDLADGTHFNATGDSQNATH